MNQYQDFRPPTALLADAPGQTTELAERGTRLGAKVIDGLLFSAVGGICGGSLFFLFVSLGAQRRIGQGVSLAFPVVAISVGVVTLAALVATIVWNCIWLSRYGQTVGKRLLKIRIVRSNGERASLGRIFLLRYLPMMLLGKIPLVGLILVLTDILFIFREDRRCLHDMMADTIVVKAE